MGKIGGSIFTVFIMISCLGTVNGVAISCCRGMYTMSCRGQGICPEKFSKLGKNQSVSFLSCLYGYGCIVLMLIIWNCGGSPPPQPPEKIVMLLRIRPQRRRDIRIK